VIDRSVIEAVRDRVDIAEIVGQTVTLKRKGSSLMGLCPFHQEKTPSFSVVPHKGIFHCFGCQEGGDVFQFVMKTRGVDFVEALKELAATCGVEVEDRQLTEDERRKVQARADLYDVCEAACQWFHGALQTRPDADVARSYLKERGITEETIGAYRLGFAPDSWDALLNHLHTKGYDARMVVEAGLARARTEGRSGAYDMFRGRLIVPIENARGKVIAFGGRVLEGLGQRDGKEPGAKYINSPETSIYRKSSILYGLPHARRAVQHKDRLLVVEGYFDVLSLHQAGFQETVATCGTALTPEHMKAIRPLTKTVVALFDSDDAGVRAAVRSMPLFQGAGIEPKRMDLGADKDPDDFIRAHSPEAFEAVLAKAEPLFELVLRRARATHGTSPEGKQRTVDELASIVRQYPGAAREAVLSRIASALGIREDVVGKWVGRARAEGGAGPAKPSRWQGNLELNHLFWLMIHHPEEVAGVIAQADPEIVTNYEPARLAFGMLMAGKELTEILDSVEDQDMARVLLAAASKDGLYRAANASFAAEQIVDKLTLMHIDEAMNRIDGQLATCTRSDDTSSYFSLVRDRQALQERKNAIRSRFAR
jgi:DNA primase